MSKKYYLKPKLTKGVIVLCNHGYAGDGGTFYNMFIKLNKYSQTLGVKTYPQNSLGFGDPLSTSVYEDLKENARYYTKKIVFIKTRFKDPINGDISAQADELDTIIDNIYTSLGNYKSQYEIILLGHSKGGLVNMYYGLKNKNKCNKFISINTPYNGLINSVQQLGWTMTDHNICIQINDLASLWNNTLDSLLPKVCCIATNKDGTNADDRVENSSALGEKASKPLEWIENIKYKNIFLKTILSGEGDLYQHEGCLCNDDLVYNILLTIQKLI